MMKSMTQFIHQNYQHIKNVKSFLRKMIDLSVSSQMFLRFMEGTCMIKQQPIVNISFLDIKAVFARVIVLNNVCQLGLKSGKNVDNRGVFGALLTDLSKAFDCIPHDLIIAKVEAYGFHIDPLKLVHNYLSNRKQS